MQQCIPSCVFITKIKHRQISENLCPTLKASISYCKCHIFSISLFQLFLCIYYRKQINIDDTIFI